MAPTVILAKDLKRSLRLGHPWVYRRALEPAPSFDDGTLVTVCDRRRTPIALGFWDARSPIAVRVLSLTSPVEPEALVRERLAAALARRLRWLDLSTTNAFRLVHGEADGLPGVHADVYADLASVRFDGAGARAFYAGLPRLLEMLPGLPLRGVVDRERRSDAEPRTVLENGLFFRVDLGIGQKGGLFLDQRENRAEIERRSRGRRVLNLFGYTGGFSLYAARGGAERTDTVDQARPALDAARDNFALNHLPIERAGFFAGDAFEFLERAARHGERWDIVISDPPSFAKTERTLPAARRAYRRLHGLAARVVEPGGLFCPASCSSHFPRDEFLASVRDGVRSAGRHFRLEALRGAGADHPSLPAFPEGDYLKFALGAIE